MKKSDINVLIVDDDKAIGKTLSEAIVRAGYKPLWASRADEALNMVRLKHVHVAVIDCMLPVKNGVQLGEELRKTRFDNGAIVLMSGIFRDKSFEAEALKKTGAIAYLEKPFGPVDLLAALKPALDGLADGQKWTLQSVLTKKIESVRDRVKIVEHLEEIRAGEVALVLSILLEARISGFLNLASSSGDIYGISIHNGKVMGVDSDQADELAIRFLIDTGYLTQQDWDEFTSTQDKKARLQLLVNSGYISPHAAFQARRDQIIYDLKRILKSERLNLSFVPDTGDGIKGEGVEMLDLFLEMSDALDQSLQLDYLKDFFQSMSQSTMKAVSTLSADHAIWNLPIVARVKDRLPELNGQATLQNLLAKNPAEEGNFLKATYLFVIFGQVIFTDVGAMKNFEAEASRRQKLFDSLKGKNPIDIFVSFGTSKDAKATEVEAVFKEFVKSNHPDRLPPDAPESLRKVTDALFGTVSGAYDTLANPEKRAAYDAQVQSVWAEKEIKADTLSNEALELIRRGTYAKAEAKINEAMAIRKDDQHFLCLMIWAKLKQNSRLPKTEILNLQRQLDQIPNMNRGNPFFHMAQGLVRMANGDVNAVNSFEKALSLDGGFVEARREINALAGANKEAAASSASDILTGDITSIVSQIFKRKAK